MADPAKQMKTNQTVVIFMSVVLLFGAVNAVMITADEYDPSTLVWMHLGLDAVMTVLLLVLLVQVGKAAAPGGLKTLALVVGAAGFVAGLVKLAARFSSDHGWWTGHFSYAF
ncbi:hypothetical protein MCELHM10_00233 [Paracoccaceae bacterium]